MTFTPGDILLVNDYDTTRFDLLGNLIRAGERARYGNSDVARWTHSALIVSTDGEIIEAMANGITRGHIDKYAHVETLVINLPIPAEDPRRAYTVRFAESRVGVSYDVLDFISLAGSLLTRLPWSLHSDPAMICSGECSRGTEACTVSGYPYSPERMMPGDLAVYWKAYTHGPLPPLSFFGRVLDLVRHVAWALSPFRSGVRP